jgi:hypothetical protein
MIWFLWKPSPCCPPFWGFALSLLAHTFPLSHGVGPNFFRSILATCKTRSLIHMSMGTPMDLCLRWLHTCLTDSTLYYFSFVVYAVTPLSFKEGDDPSSLVHLFALAMH